MSIIEKAYERIVPIIENLGYEVVEITEKQLHGELNLTFFIYKPEGITLEDCEAVNNAIDEPLDTLDITEGKPYVLNVSSPGLDRPIVTKRDFERNINKEIEILFSDGKKKKVNGTLIAFDENTITLVSKGKELVINKENAAIVRPYIKF